jgi:hypothetical protein
MEPTPLAGSRRPAGSRAAVLKMTVNWLLCMFAVGALACSAGGMSRSTHTVGFWYEANAFVIPGQVAERIGGPINAAEKRSIEAVSRSEVERAFSNLRVTVTGSDGAFWRVKVVESIPVRSKRQGPAAGESLPLGFLGGIGFVGLDLVSAKAVDYAPVDADRQTILEAIGRGVGRVAVHEFIHQMLGSAFSDDFKDDSTYEYGRPDRPSQYFGDLRWGAAWPLLQGKVGMRAAQ